MVGDPTPADPGVPAVVVLRLTLIVTLVCAGRRLTLKLTPDVDVTGDPTEADVCAVEALDPAVPPPPPAAAAGKALAAEEGKAVVGKALVVEEGKAAEKAEAAAEAAEAALMTEDRGGNSGQSIPPIPGDGGDGASGDPSLERHRDIML